MEGRLGEHLEDKLFFHYPHLDNTAKNYSWIAAPVVISFMVVVVMAIMVMVKICKHHGCSHQHIPTVSVRKPDMGYASYAYIVNNLGAPPPPPPPPVFPHLESTATCDIICGCMLYQVI